MVAYFCISAGAVERAAAPGKAAAQRTRHDPGFGDRAAWRSAAITRARGSAPIILSDALRRIAVASQSIGIGAVLVHAKDDAAKRFYMKCAEFIEYPEDSRTLFLPIETVVAAFC